VICFEDAHGCRDGQSPQHPRSVSGASPRLLVLVEREEDLGWPRRAFMPLSQTLHHHHHAEEAMLFPPQEGWSLLTRDA
jgi:hypothetical protein